MEFGRACFPFLHRLKLPEHQSINQSATSQRLRVPASSVQVPMTIKQCLSDVGVGMVGNT